MSHTRPPCAAALAATFHTEQMGESEVPAYLQDETTGPATVVPAAPAATSAEQVDEFGYA